jgi:amino-acid N-acetyltransferase
MQCMKEAVGSTRLTIESELSMGLPNSPMHGAHIRVVGGNFITAKPIGVQDGIDFQRAGQVRRIENEAIDAQLSNGSMVQWFNGSMVQWFNGIDFANWLLTHWGGV